MKMASLQSIVFPFPSVSRPWQGAATVRSGRARPGQASSLSQRPPPAWRPVAPSALSTLSPLCSLSWASAAPPPKSITMETAPALVPLKAPSVRLLIHPPTHTSCTGHSRGLQYALTFIGEKHLGQELGSGRPAWDFSGRHSSSPAGVQGSGLRSLTALAFLPRQSQSCSPACTNTWDRPHGNCSFQRGLVTKGLQSRSWSQSLACPCLSVGKGVTKVQGDGLGLLPTESTEGSSGAGDQVCVPVGHAQARAYDTMCVLHSLPRAPL